MKDKIGRRDFMYLSGAFVASIGLFSSASLVRGKGDHVRPPGSVPEEEFLKRCILCQRCIDVCPTDVIHSSPMTQGYNDFRTPYLTFETRSEARERVEGQDEVFDRNANDQFGCIRCEQFGYEPCYEKCPTDAIKSIDIDEVDMGTAVINRDTCLDWNPESFNCLVCSSSCPEVDDAADLVEGDALRRDEDENIYVDEEYCIGCGQCYTACPVVDDPEEEDAIYIIPDGAYRPEP